MFCCSEICRDKILLPDTDGIQSRNRGGFRKYMWFATRRFNLSWTCSHKHTHRLGMRWAVRCVPDVSASALHPDHLTTTLWVVLEGKHGNLQKWLWRKGEEEEGERGEEIVVVSKPLLRIIVSFRSFFCFAFRKCHIEFSREISRPPTLVIPSRRHVDIISRHVTPSCGRSLESLLLPYVECRIPPCRWVRRSSFLPCVGSSGTDQM